MTRYTPAGSIEDAVAHAIRVLSPEEIEAAACMTVSGVRKQAERGLHFITAARLDRALKAKGLRALFMPLLVAMSETEGPGPATDIGQELTRTTAELGDLARIYADAITDGRLDIHERRRIAHAAQDVMDHAQMVRDAAEPPMHGGAVTPIPVKGRVG